MQLKNASSADAWPYPPQFSIFYEADIHDTVVLAIAIDFREEKRKC